MFIKNFTLSDLTLNIRGNSITLAANGTTLIPDGLVTIAELQGMFGKQVVAVADSGPSTTIMTNQQVASTGKLYLAEPTTQTGDVRIWIEGSSSTVDIYGSDSQTIPTSLASMSCPTGNTGVSGLCQVASMPRYIAFKVNTGTPTIIVTNLKLHEVGSIS